MKAKRLYAQLDKDFGIESLKDDWSFMKFNEFIAPDFKKRYIGIVLDNTMEVKKVYTSVFPDLEILEKLIHSDETNVLLFSHHAMGYDPNIQGFPFYDIPGTYLSRLKQQCISFYVLHMPLDKNGEYSTSVSLARKLELEITGEFCEYEGINVGVLCKTEIKTAKELSQRIESIAGHPVKLMAYGDETIIKGRVAVAAGGGSLGFVAQELSDMGINMYITGCIRPVPTFEPVMEFHRIAAESRINVIGATHYTTEKFACIAMTKYFGRIGMQADFIEGNYFPEDL